MKSGANYVVLFKLDVDTTAVDSVVFTFQAGEKVTKTYPTDVTYSKGLFAVSLKQSDTEKLVGAVLAEAQINYSNKAVAKTGLQRLFFEQTLNTVAVTGDTPSTDTPEDITFEVIGNAIVAKVEGDIDPEDIAEAVEEYMEEHPVEAGITEEECEEIVAEYVTEHKEELKGDKGDTGSAGRDGVDGATGPAGADGDSAYDIAVNHGYVGTEEQWLSSLKGADGTNGVDGHTPVKGTDYWTESDKADIVADVLSSLPQAESEVY